MKAYHAWLIMACVIEAPHTSVETAAWASALYTLVAMLAGFADLGARK